MKISFVGGGSFGTSLAVLLAKKEFEISVWCHSQGTVDEINNQRTNRKYLKDISIPDNVTAFSDIEPADVYKRQVFLLEL